MFRKNKKMKLLVEMLKIVKRNNNYLKGNKWIRNLMIW